MHDGDWVAETATDVRGVLKVMVDAGWLPGGTAVIGTGSMWEYVAVGGLTQDPEEMPASPEVLYDCASLTKVMATWPLIGAAVADGLIGLDTPMGRYIPGGPYAGGEITVRQILTHTSRLNPVAWLETYVGTRQDLAEAILSEPLDEEGYRYIDRGFILLGLTLERLMGIPLDAAASQWWGAAGMAATMFGPVPRSAGVAPTERRLPGAGATWGVVHDEAAALMGGVAGHAGMFSNAIDLGTFARELYFASDGEEDPLLSAAFIDQSWRGEVPVGDGVARGLGWMVGADGVVHHHGYTGTSLFVQPETGRYVGLLTNAVHYGRKRTGLSDLRAAARACFGD